MKKNPAIFLILVIGIFFYLNRSYARIYDRDESRISNISWTYPITITNPSFQNKVKYVSIGDSLAMGIGSKDATKTLPFIVANKLSQRMSVTLVNIAVIGATSDEVLLDQLNNTITQKPDYITLFLGTNDIHNLIPSSKFEENMNYIIKMLANKTSAKIIVFNIPYLGLNNLILFPYNLLFDYQIKQYNRVLTRISEANKIILIDLYNPTKDNFSKQPNFYSNDNFHPSEEGYLLWGTLVDSEDF